MFFYDHILLLIYIILQSLIAGTISAVVGRLITNYEGPFNVFPRLQQSLLPHTGQPIDEPPDPSSVYDLVNNLAAYQMDYQTYLGEIQAWELHFENSPAFKRTIQGTIWGILTCIFCIGPYMSFVIAGLLSLYLRSGVPMFLIVWGLSFSGHYFISKKLEGCYDS